MFFLWDNRAASLSLYWVAAKATYFLFLGGFLMKTKLTNWERRAVMASCIPALLAAFAAPASAMHIMEGFLPQTHAIV